MAPISERNEQLKLIDHYLEGELSSKQKRRFEVCLDQNDFRSVLQEELIDRYLAEGLMPEQSRRFEEFLKEPDFREQLQLRESLGKVIALESEEQLDPTVAFFRKEEQRIRRLEREPSHQVERAIIPLRRMLSIAAGFLLMISVGFTSWVNLYRSPGAIVQQEYQLPISEEEILGRPASETLLKEARSALRNQQYRRATELLSQIDDPQDEYYYQARYLKAHAFLKMEDYAAAGEQFDWVLRNFDKFAPGQLIRSDLDWYRLLAYLGNEQQDKAKQLMQTLKNTPYRGKVEEIQKKLRWQFLVF